MSSTNFAIYSHKACVNHLIPGHVEQPGRVLAILKKVNDHFHSSIFRDASLISNKEILGFHTVKHLQQFEEKCTKSEKRFSEKQEKKYIQIDGDTTVMWKTREAAYRAAGALKSAIDDIYDPQPSKDAIQTAFCLVRPPGHHAERDRACGFCFLNNVGIGARYAQLKYNVERVAVVDFDVHHGNGTEEGFSPFDSLFFGSTHEMDNYPGSGDDPTPHIGENAKYPLDRRIVNRKLSKGPLSRTDFTKKWTEIMDEMILFRPNLVIISAGFDAHDEDPLSDTELTVEDFVWATNAVLEACVRINPDSPPPCISSLEGGYDLNALADCALAHAKCLANASAFQSQFKASSSAASAALVQEVIHTSEITLTVDETSSTLTEEFITTTDVTVDDSIGTALANEESADGDEVAALEKYIESLGLGI